MQLELLRQFVFLVHAVEFERSALIQEALVMDMAIFWRPVARAFLALALLCALAAARALLDDDQ